MIKYIYIRTIPTSKMIEKMKWQNCLQFLIYDLMVVSCGKLCIITTVAETNRCNEHSNAKAYGHLCWLQLKCLSFWTVFKCISSSNRLPIQFISLPKITIKYIKFSLIRAIEPMYDWLWCRASCTNFTFCICKNLFPEFCDNRRFRYRNFASHLPFGCLMMIIQ